MSQLLVVRHGQARLFEANYDRLSERGHRQARLLGEHWVRRGILFDEVYTGPCTRQMDSAAAIGEVYSGSGVEWPECTRLEEFDEFPAEAILRAALPAMMEKHDCMAELYKQFTEATDPVIRSRVFHRGFEFMTQCWIDGSLELDGIETWPQFCDRVERGLARILEGSRGRRIALFTSAGPIGIMMRRALGTADRRSLDLAWLVWNSSVSEFLFSGERFSLRSFNGVAHIGSEELMTLW